ncbi:hypothetical protein BU16DRAFT_261197 [Lophium mytilinum]|uniref:Uncharacterized protein n=1 Tax=Lophium mytilinum TaxID=390894 RepID=A0A6A6R2S8_9PEZI|nr:hypothetical protein BU16DRAFT_261197 [Lophium mytilinum]
MVCFFLVGVGSCGRLLTATGEMSVLKWSGVLCGRPREARDKAGLAAVSTAFAHLRPTHGIPGWQAHHAEPPPFGSSALANICAALEVEPVPLLLDRPRAGLQPYPLRRRQDHPGQDQWSALLRPILLRHQLLRHVRGGIRDALRFGIRAGDKAVFQAEKDRDTGRSRGLGFVRFSHVPLVICDGNHGWSWLVRRRRWPGNGPFFRSRNFGSPESLLRRTGSASCASPMSCWSLAMVIMGVPAGHLRW